MLVSKITALPFFHSYLVSPTFIQHSPSGTSRATWQVIMKLFLSLCGLMPLFGPISTMFLAQRLVSSQNVRQCNVVKNQP